MQNYDSKFIDYINIDSTVQEMKDENDVNVIVANNTKQKVNNQFVILFYDSLLSIINDYKLKQMDLKVLLVLLKKMEYGNLLKYTQNNIAKQLKTQQPNVSRSLKNLRESGILILTEDKEEYINPQIINKGNLKKQKKSQISKFAKEKHNINNY